MRAATSPDGTLTYHTVLKLKLKLSAEQPEYLLRVAKICRRGRNAGAVNWLMRQHGYPLSEKQAQRLIATKADKDKKDKPKSESTLIYHAIRDASPELPSIVHSMLASQIDSYLKGKVDWREEKTEDGKRPRRRDAIVGGNARPPYFTALEIPVRATHVRFRYFDQAALTCSILTDGPVTVEVSTKELGNGYRRILKEISAGQRKVADSKLLLKNKEWFWYLPVAFEVPAVQSESVATLWPTIPDPEEYWQRGREHPFKLTLPGRDRPWGCGLGEWYVRQSERIETRRKLIGERYRHRLGNGHGRKKWDIISERIGLTHARLTDEVRKKCIAEIVRKAREAGCGTILYREPSLPLRDKCWFANNAVGSVNWDWTRFAVDLENSAARFGIRVVVKQLKWKEAFPDGAYKTADRLCELSEGG